MPIYEYQCNDCSERQEVIQRFSDPPLAECPSCGGSMKKLPSSPAIQFKGSGFYKTDYASGSGSSSSAKGEGKSSDTKSSDAKSDGGSASTSSSSSSESSSSKSESTASTKSESKSAE